MNSYNLIWVNDNYDLINPKNLIGMTKEKAIGSLKWTDKVMTKDFKSFIYDPEEESIFDDQGNVDHKKIDDLIIRSKDLKEKMREKKHE